MPTYKALVVASLVVFGMLPRSSSEQQVYAEIKGVVKDPSGGIVQQAEVTATNTKTGVRTTVPSAADGAYSFLQLPVGVYDVTVVKNGFAPFTETGIVLVLNQIYDLPVALELDRAQTSVEVTADRVQVEQSTTQLGNVIEAPTIVDLPLNGRNWTQLQQLSPGVVAASDRSGTYATDGSQSQQNSYLINGADSIDLERNLPSIVPSPDAIQEFNLIDSTINPEFGRNSGAILNAIIKSGTNQFHASAFEFYRDTFLDGRNLFQQSPPIYHQNQFGGTLGGPIWKDHTFFFVSYQGSRFRQPQSGVSGQTTVFTGAQRSGYFPDIATSSAVSPIPLTGESGTVYPAGTPYSVLFPTGHIPTTDFNPISQKLLSYVPAPNAGSGLYSFNPLQTGAQDQGIARVDHTFSWKDTIWASTFFEDSPTTSTLPAFGATLPGFAQLDSRVYKQITADWTHTFNPTMLNDFRASYLRFNYAAVYPQNPTQPASLGFTGINPQYPAGAGVPLISVAGYFNLGFSPEGPQPRIDENYELSDAMSKVIGNHTWKFGFNAKRYQINNPMLSYNSGAFSFGGAGAYSTGDPGADFLLGIPDSYQQQSGGWIDARAYEYYAYVQDNWKVSQNLTINYGAGYQIDTPLVNQRFGGEDVNCFRPGQQSTVFPTAPQGLLFPGDAGCSSSGYYDHFDHVGPRFGFAYSPGSSSQKSLVIRGGFGIYFNRSEEELTLQNLGAAPFSLSSYGIAGAAGTLGIANPSPNFANPFMDIATGQSTPNPFPFTPPTHGSVVDFSPFLPLDISAIDPNFTAPYAMNYNLNVQRELPGAMLLQVGYVGAQGRHLEMTYEGNPISPAGQAACAADPNCIANRAFQHVLYPSHALYAPGDIFASVGIQATNGVSNYNSLQVSLNKRLSYGLTFLASYTWSHSIDDTSGYENASNGYRGIDPFNFGLYRGDSSFDARQRFVFSYDYEIPRISHTRKSVVNGILNGWHVAGITTLQTGFPIDVADTGFRSLSCDAYTYYGCPDAPNSIAPVQTLNPRSSSLVNTTRSPGNTTSLPYYYFNPNDFALEPIGTIGDAGRNFFHGPGINNTDLSLSKRFYFRTEPEQRFLELRLEGYNIFNHTQFSPIPIAALGNGVYSDINSRNFGRVLSAAPGRTIQLGAKVYF
jgi:hypothetical protein